MFTLYVLASIRPRLRLAAWEAGAGSLHMEPGSWESWVRSPVLGVPYAYPLKNLAQPGYCKGARVPTADLGCSEPEALPSGGHWISTGWEVCA